jgi:hypothetical protein
VPTRPRSAAILAHGATEPHCELARMTARYTEPPMTLATCARTAFSLSIYCEACHHQAVRNVDLYGDDVLVVWCRRGVRRLRHDRRRRAAGLATARDGRHGAVSMIPRG